MNEKCHFPELGEWHFGPRGRSRWSKKVDWGDGVGGPKSDTGRCLWKNGPGTPSPPVREWDILLTVLLWIDIINEKIKRANYPRG